MTAVWRIDAGAGPRLRHGSVGSGPEVLLPAGVRVADLLTAGGWDALPELAAGGEPVPAAYHELAPLDEQDVWAAGVTYRRSRDARLAESGQLDAYDKVYVAEQAGAVLEGGPAARRAGPGETVGIRADSSWDVPEPELAVVVDAAGRIVAATIGNDVSSRSIEGENPLYLPQAKTYRHSLGLGPALVGWEDLPDLMAGSVAMTVRRGGAVVVDGSVQLSQMQREPADLVRWLLRAREFPHGAVLLTGTGIVPEPGFTLAAGDEVRITITGLGELVNPVEVVGAPEVRSSADGGTASAGVGDRRQETGVPGPSPAASTAGSCASTSPPSVASRTRASAPRNEACTTRPDAPVPDPSGDASGDRPGVTTTDSGRTSTSTRGPSALPGSSGTSPPAVRARPSRTVAGTRELSPTNSATKRVAGRSYTSCGAASCSSRPALMTPTWSATASASSWSCVTKTAVVPTSSWIRRISSRSCVRTRASSADSGSSSSSTRGRIASARASATRCCWPPDICPA